MSCPTKRPPPRTRDEQALLAAIHRHASEDGLCLAAIEDLGWLAGLGRSGTIHASRGLIGRGDIWFREAPTGDRHWIIVSAIISRSTSSLSPPARRPTASAREAVDGGTSIVHAETANYALVEEREGAPA